jgi:hypothetical protein
MIRKSVKRFSEKIMLNDPKRFRAKWAPVRVKKTRQKNPEKRK